jgi:uncharacterized membrane protein
MLNLAVVDRAKKIKPSNNLSLQLVLPWLITIAGLTALLASFFLTLEVFTRLKNPSYVPICNLNPVLSCTSVADSAQSHLFGFPNYFLGLAGYGAVTAIGVGLLAGARFKKWFWQVINSGLFLAVIFLHWLIFQTLYRIGALCIFCMMVWATTIPIFWYVSLYNLKTGNLKAPKRLNSVVAFMHRHHGDILLVWFILVILLIGKRFWYYWSGLF